MAAEKVWDAKLLNWVIYLLSWLDFRTVMYLASFGSFLNYLNGVGF